MDFRAKKIKKIPKNLLWAGGILVLLTLVNLSIVVFTDVTSMYYSETTTTVEFEAPTPLGIYFTGHRTGNSTCTGLPSDTHACTLDIAYTPTSGFLVGGLGYYKLIEFNFN